MGIYWDINAPIEKIYSAYGTTIKGKWNDYISSITNVKERACIEIYINDKRFYYGNNFVVESIIKRFADTLCWYVANCNPNDYDLEKIIYDELGHNSDFAFRKIEQMRRRENKEREILENNKRWEDERNSVREEMQKKAEKNGYRYVEDIHEIYLFKVTDELKDKMFAIKDATLLQIMYDLRLKDYGIKLIEKINIEEEVFNRLSKKYHITGH